MSIEESSALPLFGVYIIVHLRADTIGAQAQIPDSFVLVHRRISEGWISSRVGLA